MPFSGFAFDFGWWKMFLRALRSNLQYYPPFWAPVYHIHSLLVVVSEGRVHVFCPLTRQSLYITVLYIIAVGSQKAGWSFSLSSLMSEVSSKVARNGSPASRGHVHPLITQILCSQCRVISGAAGKHPGHTAFPVCVTVYKPVSLV